MKTTIKIKRRCHKHPIFTRHRRSVDRFELPAKLVFTIISFGASLFIFHNVVFTDTVDCIYLKFQQIVVQNTNNTGRVLPTQELNVMDIDEGLVN